MKTEIKIKKLMKEGLSSNTVSKLNERQIDLLYSRLIGESKKEAKEEIKKTVTNVTYDPSNSADQQKLAQMGVHIDPNTRKITMNQTGGAITNEEMSEDETDDVTDKNALGADALQNLTGQEAPHDANDMAPDGMDDDSNNNRKMMGMSEEKMDKDSPYAICTSQLGKEFGTRKRHLWSAKQKNKYERCVVDVKKSLKEGKNPVSLFLENEIMKIVEKNLPPRITKGDLVKYLSENGPATAPTKPATKPTTKPGKPDPRPRPKHPGKNPNPGENPAPKARKVSPDDAKDKVMDLIMKILEK